MEIVWSRNDPPDLKVPCKEKKESEKGPTDTKPRMILPGEGIKRTLKVLVGILRKDPLNPEILPSFKETGSFSIDLSDHHFYPLSFPLLIFDYKVGGERIGTYMEE